MIYNKINSIYDKSLNKQKRYTNLKSQGSQFLFENPIKVICYEKTGEGTPVILIHGNKGDHPEIEMKIENSTKSEASNKTRIKEKEHKQDTNGEENFPSPPNGTLSTQRDRGSGRK